MELTPEGWTRIEALFHEVCAMPPGDREAYLARAGHEGEVVAVVRRLLAADARAPVADADLSDSIASLLSPAGPEELPESNFGPYRVIDVLGSGGMGVVYLAVRDDVGAKVALKVLWDAPLSPDRRTRFEAEQRTLAALSHPGIVPLYDSGQTADGVQWFAMEHVEGSPITRWVAERGLPIRRRLLLFREICLAVRAAHERLIVHGDLKPSNIMVGVGGNVRLLDFGISARLDAPAAPNADRQLTPAYASPERRTQDGAGASVRDDLYALGVLLHEMLTGERPTLAGFMAKPSATERGEDWQDLTALVRGALAQSAPRYSSAEALLRDVERYLDGMTLELRPASPGYRLRKFVTRNRAAVLMSTVVALSGAGALALHNRTLTRSRNAILIEVERTTQLRRFMENLFLGGAPTGVTGDSIRVGAIIRNGMREAKALTSDPAMQMELLESLAIMSEGLGQYNRADSLIHSARQVGEQLYGSKDPRTLQTRVRHAGLLIIRDSASAAEGELRDVIASVSQSDAGHPVHSEAYFALGRMLRVVGRTDEGLAALRRAVEVRGNRDTLSLPFVEALRELGNAAAAGGNWSLADSAWKRALPIAQRVLGPGHPQTSFLLTNLGNGASQLGDLAGAEGHLRSSVDVMRDWYGSDHYLTAATQYVLTQTLVRQRKYSEAGPLIEHVIDVYAKSPLLGPRSPNYALAVGLQGTVFDKVGEHAKARERFVRAAELLRSSWGNEHKDVLHFEASAALTLVFAGQGDSAVALLEDIASRAERALGRRSLSTAQIHAQLATALVSVRRYADVVRVSEPAIQVMDSVLGGVRPVSYPLREDLALAYDALGDSTKASAVRQILQAKE